MTLPSIGVGMTASLIRDEFFDSDPVSLGEFRGKSIIQVSSGVEFGTTLPSSPNPISYSDFYGASYSYSINYLIVGGGGAGGRSGNNGAGGGGGAGGLLVGSLTGGNGLTYIDIELGSGGTANSGNGGDSVIKNKRGSIIVTANGGGGGASSRSNGNVGGSGGGAGMDGGNSRPTRSGGAGIAGQGYAGGGSRRFNDRGFGGGGGGKGGVGGFPTASVAGSGGTGYNLSDFGMDSNSILSFFDFLNTTVWPSQSNFPSGFGRRLPNSMSGLAGGAGGGAGARNFGFGRGALAYGGGNGGESSSNNPVIDYFSDTGCPYTGGGGGGDSGKDGKSGGSGVCILRYANIGTFSDLKILGSGGSKIIIQSNYIFHVFYNNGRFTW